MNKSARTHRRHAVSALFTALAAALAPTVRADLVVVVNARSGVNSLTRDETVNIFMGRHRQYPNGARAVPLDAPADSPERVQFYRLLINKEPQEVNAYWARLVFTGRTQPPLEQHSTKALIDRLETDPRAIAYVDDSQVTRNMQVVMKPGPGQLARGVP